MIQWCTADKVVPTFYPYCELGDVTFALMQLPVR